MMSKAAQKHLRLDLLVGQKLMGFRLKKKRMGNCKHPIGYRLETRDGQHVGMTVGFFGWGWHHNSDSAWFGCPRYSTEISAAWQVWSLMAENNSLFQCFLEEACKLACRSRRTWSFQEGLRKMTPEIICKAALQVKGISLRKLAV